MNTRKRHSSQLLLGPWALVPCTLLLGITTIMMVMAFVQADDFEREMTTAEVFMAFTPLIPLVWLVSIIGSRILELRRRNSNHVAGLVIAIVILGGYVAWFVM